MAAATHRPGWRERWAAAQDQLTGRRYAAEYDRWRQLEALARDMMLRTIDVAGQPVSHVQPQLRLRRDEQVLWETGAAGMVDRQPEETLCPPGEWTFALDESFDAGLSSPRVPVTEVGSVVVTTMRVVFQGSRKREWDYPKLTGIGTPPDGRTLMRVSNRRYVSGLSMDPGQVVELRFAIAVGLGRFTDTALRLEQSLAGQLGAIRRAEPVPPPPADPRSAPWSAVRPMIVGAAVAFVLVMCFGCLSVLALTQPEVDNAGDVASVETSAAVASTEPQPDAEPSSSPVPESSVPATSVKPTPSSAPASSAEPKPEPEPEPESAQVDLCGAPQNPYGYNFCGNGAPIYDPDGGTCSYFDCIDNFSAGKGYMVQCGDGMFSMSGGRSGSCSHHDGVAQQVYG